MPFANSKLAYVVIWGQVIAFIILVAALCLTLFYRNYSDPVVLVALIGLTGTLAGNLGSILGGPRAMMSATGTDENPLKTEVTNTKSNPVPTTDQPKG